MMVVMLVAGFGFVLAGLLAIGFGIPVKEFSFGNTLILTGVLGVCTGAIMLGLWMAVRELKNVARRLGAGISAEPQGEVVAQPLAPRAPAPVDGGFLFSRDQPPAAEHAGRAEPAAPAPPRPWHEEAASRDRPRSEVPPETEPAEAASPAKPKRNLLFSSSSRKERERGQTRTSEPLPPDILSPELRPNPPAAPPPLEATEAPPASFDTAWPKSERPRPLDEVPPQRRSPRPPSATPAAPPSTFSEVNGAAGQPQVTVLKSGVVDGMAYSLYSDGSIEAQMPEGMMRFNSIAELRTHLDQRP